MATRSVKGMARLVEIIDTLDGPINVYDDGSQEFFEVPRDPKSDPPTAVESSVEPDQKGCWRSVQWCLHSFTPEAITERLAEPVAVVQLDCGRRAYPPPYSPTALAAFSRNKEPSRM